MATNGEKYWQLAAKTGRPPKYTPDTLWEKAVEYFEWVEDHPLKESVVTRSGEVVEIDRIRAMTIRAFCLFAGIDEQTFANYGEKAQFLGIITRIRYVIYQQKFEGASADLLNANLISRELGLASKQEISGPNQGPIQITGMVIK